MFIKVSDIRERAHGRIYAINKKIANILAIVCEAQKNFSFIANRFHRIYMKAGFMFLDKINQISYPLIALTKADFPQPVRPTKARRFLGFD